MLMTCPKCGKLVQGKEGDQCPDCKIFLRPPRRLPVRGEEDDSPAVSRPQAVERPVTPGQVGTGETGTGGGWITFLRGASWVSFVLILLVGLYYSSFMRGTGGFVFALCSVLVPFIALAATMIALDAAENIRRTADNTKRILEILNRQGKR